MRLISLISLILASVLTLNPILALAQQASVIAEAKAAAEADARADTSSGLWFIAGCLGGWLGVLIAYVYQPSPPASRLLGKSPEYVAAYTDAYKDAVKRIQARWAWRGCLANAAAYVAYIALVAMATALSTTQE